MLFLISSAFIAIMPTKSKTYIFMYANKELHNAKSGNRYSTVEVTFVTQLVTKHRHQIASNSDATN